MSSRKKERSCPFPLAKGRPKKVKNTFDKEWTAKLVESDKGSFNTKKNSWMNSIFGGGVPPASPNPDPISDQKMPFPTSVFRPGF